MKNLKDYFKESLLDMDMDPIEHTKLIEISIIDMIKSLLQYTKKIHYMQNSVTLIFDKKYNLIQWNDIAQNIKSNLESIDIKYNYESGITEQGSLKIYYNDIDFRIKNGFEISIDFSYPYRKYIARENNTDKPSESPEPSLVQIAVFGNKGRDFFKILKKELINEK